MVGTVAASVQYAVLIGLVELASVDAVLASAIGFIVSGFVNYALNYRYTFRSNLPHSVALPKFAITLLLGLVINTSTMHVCVETIGIYYMVSQMIAIGVTLVWHFTINSIWSFRSRTTSG